MEQLLLHLIGDYITQSDWMANNKTKATWPALCHSVIYSLPFLLICPPLAVGVIWVTHLLIDRFRLARYVVYAKNKALSPSFPAWSECNITGYKNDTPAWLSVWLLIIADNTLHLAINYLAIRYL